MGGFRHRLDGAGGHGSRRRGVSRFGLVVFVMLLASTALMYYWFRRARALESELSVLRSGQGRAEATPSGVDASAGPAPGAGSSNPAGSVAPRASVGDLLMSVRDRVTGASPIPAPAQTPAAMPPATSFPDPIAATPTPAPPAAKPAIARSSEVSKPEATAAPELLNSAAIDEKPPEPAQNKIEATPKAARTTPKTTADETRKPAAAKPGKVRSMYDLLPADSKKP